MLTGFDDPDRKVFHQELDGRRAAIFISTIAMRPLSFKVEGVKEGDYALLTARSG